MCGLGVISKLVTSSLYKRLIKETGNMALTKNKNLRSLKQKTENMLMLSHGIRNTNAYIEKQLYGFRFMRLSLDGWDNLSVQAMILCFLIGGIAAFGAYWYRVDSYYIVLYGSMGILSGLSLVFVDNSVNISVKRQQLVESLIDYVDNTPHFFRSVDKSVSSDGTERRAKSVAESSKFRLREMGRKNLKVVKESAVSEELSENRREEGAERNAVFGSRLGFRNNVETREGMEIEGEIRTGQLEENEHSGKSSRGSGKFSVLSRKKGRKEPAVHSVSTNKTAKGAGSPGDFAPERKNDAWAQEEELRRSIDGLKQSLEQIAASREQMKSDAMVTNMRVQENGGLERAKRELSQEDIKLLGELLQEYLT